MSLEPMQVVTTSLDTTVRALVAQLRGMGATTDDARAEPFDGVEVVGQLGFESRPAITDNTEAIVYRDGQDVVILALVDKGRPKLTDLEEGETRMSGAKEVVARIRIRASGAISIDAKAGQDVTFNGGTLKVARETDPVNVCTLTATSPSGPVTFVLVPLDASGAPGAPVTSPTVTVPAVIAHAGGAPHVKA